MCRAHMQSSRIPPSLISDTDSHSESMGPPPHLRRLQPRRSRLFHPRLCALAPHDGPPDQVRHPVSVRLLITEYSPETYFSVACSYPRRACRRTQDSDADSDISFSSLPFSFPHFPISVTVSHVPAVHSTNRHQMVSRLRPLLGILGGHHGTLDLRPTPDVHAAPPLHRRLLWLHQPDPLLQSGCEYFCYYLIYRLEKSRQGRYLTC
jgi:hypothetical protein